MKYEMVIGLEIHVELGTKSKIFCSCSTQFGNKPNTNVCPVCLGMPGVLPVLNEKVAEYAVKAGLSLNCEIAKFSKLDRKNYFYPDLPKAYQVSQYDLPLCIGGYLDVSVGEETTRVGITRIHIEEDAGKLVHTQDGTLIDYNRCGVPLIEIVTEPDIRSAEQAVEFAKSVRNILLYAKVSDCKMQEGSMRFDVNLSVREQGAKQFGTRTEMKNLSSFKMLQKAIEYEYARQVKAVKNGERIIQQTRRWDETNNVSVVLRSKENAHDYRYFPEPDLLPVVLNDEVINSIKTSMPEMPKEKKQRYISQLSLSEYDAGVLTANSQLCEFYENILKEFNDAKTAANWVIVELMALINKSDTSIEEIKITASSMAQLLNFIKDGKISGKMAKDVLLEMFETGSSEDEIVKSKGLSQISDAGELEKIIDEILKNNQASVNDYHLGKKQAMGFLVGQVMRATKGAANPQSVNEILNKKLNN
ncbi:MAG: Asp-tRNA(Asn)/Glu-tRNA(Gln) amidotransferase subunit GatB [Eubacteriaceae bacterium]|nr:Asp-tRNA(Asn)/Glu-tRNA(Gln) amidotransferase subunit GatB [Eubacteriaceae bacterium]